tara:strand:+ start:2253 stop:2855 length:603 start_codon:yes stop_codon:yes gene_type:complete
MSYGNLVAEALLHPERSEDCQRQIACKTAASTQMVCHCGEVLDQSTVCVLERSYPEQQLADDTVVACCPACRVEADMHVVKYMVGKTHLLHPGATYTWLTWDAADVVDPSTPIPMVGRNAVPGLSVVRQTDVIRGCGKYRVVHVASDRYLSRHSSLKSARQLLAQLKGLTDWTASASTLKKNLGHDMRCRVGSLLKYYSR